MASVKDTCSQAVGFLEALQTWAPPTVHLVYAYPNYKSCASIDLRRPLRRFKRVTMLPLPLRSSPMQGWIDALPHVQTKYTLLLHNDGYALDACFACELLRALQRREDDGYVLAAPMLYESKSDGSLAAHATQHNLRLVKDGSAWGAAVKQDHSLLRALNRGHDLQEGEQTEFVEDHGFLIRTDKVRTVVDPSAAFTLEYLDMILTLRAKGWRAVFVPTARLEFRITEFSWRDVPYFMYKRSEATAQGTRDYLKAKWRINFPNTGFWTYIKYTIIEQHAFGARELEALAWREQAALAFGFFQMAGYNRYELARAGAAPKQLDFLDVLGRLERGWVPPPHQRLVARRELDRPAVTKTRPSYVDHVDALLEYGDESSALCAKAEMEHEYLPFSVARIALASCELLTPEMERACGLLLEEQGGQCVCWMNMPTFKSNSVAMIALAKLAAMIKVPSRITTFFEMALAGGRNATEHASSLSAELARLAAEPGAADSEETKAKVEAGADFGDLGGGVTRAPPSAPTVELAVCDIGQRDCSTAFSFGRGARLRQFVGAPATVSDALVAVRSVMREARRA